MKLLRTKIRNVLGAEDITRIAKSMINIYHGRKYFLDDGSVDVNAAETFLEWSEAGVKYSYRPVRGYIYINFRGGTLDTAFKSAPFRNSLLAEFQRLNRWGWRKDVWTDHTIGTSQFTLEKYDSALYTVGADMVIAVGSAFHTKYREYKFQWIVSSESNLFQYTCPGKYPKPYQLMAALTTIAVDVAHVALDISDGSHTLGFPELTKNVDVVARDIKLSYLVGVEGHIYMLMGGAPPDSKTWCPFLKYTGRFSKEHVAYVGGKLEKPVHLVKDLASLKDAEGDAKDDGVRCTTCRVPVWDKYYQVERNKNVAVVCKFCAHFTKAVNAELQSGAYNVAVAQSPTTASSLIEVAAMPQAERDVVRQLHREIQLGTIKFVEPAEGADLNFITKCNGGGIIMHSGANTTVGLMSGKTYQDVLELVHSFPDNTRVFEYTKAW